MERPLTDEEQITVAAARWFGLPVDVVARMPIGLRRCGAGARLHTLPQWGRDVLESHDTSTITLWRVLYALGECGMLDGG